MLDHDLTSFLEALSEKTRVTMAKILKAMLYAKGQTEYERQREAFSSLHRSTGTLLRSSTKAT